MSRLLDEQTVIDALTGWETEPTDEEIEYTIRQLPSAGPQERKTGKWIFNQYDANPRIGNWHCSECGKITIMPHDVYNFCPNCGARMEVDNEQIN